MIELKRLFKKLQIDAKSVLFMEKTINDKVLKKLKKSKYNKDIELVNLFKRNKDFLDSEKKSILIKITFIEKKKDIHRSTRYSFDGPFELLHADIRNSEFSGKSATNPKYCLLFVDLLTSKVYVYLMKLRKSITSKREIFYKVVEAKRKCQKTRSQTDQKFKQQKKYLTTTKNTMLTCFSPLREAVEHLLLSKNSGN